MRLINLALGYLMVALGIIGAFLPIMPTTTFLILAAYFFAKSSPRLEAWILNHKQFGPSVRAWREEKAISRRGKTASIVGMGLGFTLFWLTAKPGIYLLLGVLAFFVACGWYVLSRPEPTRTAELPSEPSEQV